MNGTASVIGNYVNWTMLARWSDFWEDSQRGFVRCGSQLSPGNAGKLMVTASGPTATSAPMVALVTKRSVSSGRASKPPVATAVAEAAATMSKAAAGQLSLPASEAHDSQRRLPSLPAEPVCEVWWKFPAFFPLLAFTFGRVATVV
jgi:hypothetical protein